MQSVRSCLSEARSRDLRIRLYSQDKLLDPTFFASPKKILLETVNLFLDRAYKTIRLFSLRPKRIHFAGQIVRVDCAGRLRIVDGLTRFLQASTEVLDKTFHLDEAWFHSNNRLLNHSRWKKCRYWNYENPHFISYSTASSLSLSLSLKRMVCVVLFHRADYTYYIFEKIIKCSLSRESYALYCNVRRT